MTPLICGSYLQNRNRLTDLENELTVTGGKGGAKGHQAGWDGHAHAAILKLDNRRGPPYSPGNSLSVVGRPGWERSPRENGCPCMYG